MPGGLQLIDRSTWLANGGDKVKNLDGLLCKRINSELGMQVSGKASGQRYNMESMVHLHTSFLHLGMTVSLLWLCSYWLCAYWAAIKYYK